MYNRNVRYEDIFLRQELQHRERDKKCREMSDQMSKVDSTIES